MVTINTPKNAIKYVCENCDFKCSKNSDFQRHLNTAKHKKVTNGDKLTPKTQSKHLCSCGKIFVHRQGLSRHKKTCTGEQETETPVQTITNDLPDEYVKKIVNDETSVLRDLIYKQQEQIQAQQEHIRQQQEQHNKQLEEHNKQIQDLIPQLQQVTNINNNNCNNTTNNKFNLNFFLNEQCKDAISIQNFIENLNIGIPELEHMGNVGYVKGMMSIFSNTLGAMDIYKRPLHCTDLKRETLYIKQGNTWKKDTEDKTELKKLIKTVEYKNYGSLRLWEREHPEAFECDTQDNIDYMRISNESLGGFDSTDAIKLGKIMKHVVREVYIK